MRKTYIDQYGEIRQRNTKDQVGFASMWHVLTLDKTLSDAAYRTYALLLKYAQQKPKAYMTVGTLADNLGKSKRSIYNALKELTERGLITREERPGTSSLTWLEEINEVYKNELWELLKDR